MMRDFQTWPHNSNQMYLTPILAKKTSKIDEFLVLGNFRQFCGRNGGQILFVFNFEERFGILLPLIISGETGEKWVIILESTLKIRKNGILVFHKNKVLPINTWIDGWSARFLTIFSLVS